MGRARPSPILPLPEPVSRFEVLCHNRASEKAQTTANMPPPSSKPKRKSAWKKLVGGLFYFVVCIIALALGTGAKWVSSSPVMWESLMQAVGNATPEAIFERDSITLLILGCDEDRVYGGAKVTRARARSDSMLVARIDFVNNRVGAVSIPRDLEVSAAGYSGRKINAYHAIGGPELAEQAAEAVVGVPIDKTIVIDYEAFQKMIDAAGGVEVYVDKDMDYDDDRGHLHIHIKKGRQHLNGYEAMGFVRFRHDALSDYARQGRQKDLMLALKDAVKHNPASLPSVINEAEAVLGGGLTSREVAALGRFLQSVAKDNIKMAMVPVNQGSGSNLNLDTLKLPEVLATNYITGPLGGISSSRP